MIIIKNIQKIYFSEEIILIIRKKEV